MKEDGHTNLDEILVDQEANESDQLVIQNEEHQEPSPTDSGSRKRKSCVVSHSESKRLDLTKRHQTTIKDMFARQSSVKKNKASEVPCTTSEAISSEPILDHVVQIHQESTDAHNTIILTSPTELGNGSRLQVDKDDAPTVIESINVPLTSNEVLKKCQPVQPKKKDNAVQDLESSSSSTRIQHFCDNYQSRLPDFKLWLKKRHSYTLG